MDCKKIQKQIFRFIYGESDEYELRAIKAHLEICNACEAEQKIIEEILVQIKSGVPDDPVPDGFKERVLSQVQALAEQDS
ncbi:zf-HC2 domain-containing protein [bacterium]|nr:zf-HC2 domain-containing protein [bacterium]